MKEKKEMQIVVTADDSKAKTKLQKLADYLKNNFENDKKQKMDIDTSLTRAKLVQVNDSISKLKSELKTIDSQADPKSFSLWADELSKAEFEADKLKEALTKADTEADKISKSAGSVGDKVSNSLEKAGKKSRKFVLSLFSIRTAWSLISRASSTYLSQNEDTSNKVAAAWSYLGNILGPIIERVVNWLQYGIAYLNVFVKALSGVDFLAKSIKKTTSATNKELKKTVSSMDEIVNLDKNSGNSSNPVGALQDIADLELNSKIVDFLEDLADALKVVWSWAKTAWNFLEENFGTVGAAAIVGGLALLLGGTGFGGLYGVLLLIAGINLIPIAEQVKSLGEAVEVVSNSLKKNNDSAKSFQSAWQESMDGLNGNDLINAVDSIINSVESAETTLESLNASLETNEDNMDKITDSFIFAGNVITATSDPITSLLMNLLGVNAAEAVLGDTMKKNNEQIEIQKDSLNTWKETLESAKTKLEEQISKTTTGTEEYEKYKKALEKVNSQLDNLNGKDVKSTATVEFQDNSDSWYVKLSEKMNGWLGKFNGWVTDLFNPGKTSKTKKYATGGFPEEGQMFIANEKGPELVGNIGSSTAVVNNQQIVDSVSIGVANAVAGVLGTQKTTSKNASYIYINGREFAKAVYNDMEDESLRRNKNTSIRRA